VCVCVCLCVECVCGVCECVCVCARACVYHDIIFYEANEDLVKLLYAHQTSKQYKSCMVRGAVVRVRYTDTSKPVVG
jgi:hypothetical protein